MNKTYFDKIGGKEFRHKTANVFIFNDTFSPHIHLFLRIQQRNP
jgi:hypothetical protein